MNYTKLIFLFAVISMIGCGSPDPNLTQTGVDELKSHELDRDLKNSDRAYAETFYVPIYSDIYLEQTNQNSLLAATLSVRNTSFSDSLFISKIDYFNTAGDLVRSYIDQPIFLLPMGTVNYVIEKEDTSGGPGANFIIDISSDNPKVKPLVQAVMVGLTGNKGFSFLTDGYPLK